VKRPVAAAAALLLAACAGVPERLPEANIQAAWQTHSAAIGALDTWKAQGRVGLRTPDDSGSASLTWVRTPAGQTIDLVGPFGGGRVHLVQDKRGATLKSGSREYRAADATQLLQRATGWHLPLAGLDYWVRGLPEPGRATLDFDTYGRLKTLVQSGWTVEYLDYRRTDNLELPTKLVLTRRFTGGEAGRSETQAGSVEVRLVIQHWTLGPDAS
jgi:outer membrane lipoprotein LolB